MRINQTNTSLPLTQRVLVVQDHASVPHPACRRHEEIVVVIVVSPFNR